MVKSPPSVPEVMLSNLGCVWAVLTKFILFFYTSYERYIHYRGKSIQLEDKKIEEVFLFFSNIEK